MKNLKARITGNSKIEGTVSVSGAKNAALPLLAASLLTKGQVQLKNLPYLEDVKEMLEILKETGMVVVKDKESTLLLKKNVNSHIQKRLSNIRASILLLGPLSILNGKAVLPYPGGCSIGKRPIDIHIMGLKKLGISVKMNEGFVEARLQEKIRQTKINLPFPSVGATEHLMMSASILKGTSTTIQNCAMEPEILELQKFLNSMGANVKGAGTPTITIEGQELNSTKYKIMGDRIEAGTYMILALAAGTRLRIENIDPQLANYIDFFKNIGAHFSIGNNFIETLPAHLNAFTVKTAPYPGFPTDLQPQLSVLACALKGESKITETVFENRFSHVEELKKMGACITKKGNRILVHGPTKLRAATLNGKDLRQTATLILAAAIAHGTSVIENFEIVFRGYENVVNKLKNIGVNISLSEYHQLSS